MLRSWRKVLAAVQLASKWAMADFVASMHRKQQVSEAKAHKRRSVLEAEQETQKREIDGSFHGRNYSVEYSKVWNERGFLKVCVFAMKNAFDQRGDSVVYTSIIGVYRNFGDSQNPSQVHENSETIIVKLEVPLSSKSEVCSRMQILGVMCLVSNALFRVTT